MSIRGVGMTSGARVLAILGDSITTDHISPAGDIRKRGQPGGISGGARRHPGGFQFLRRAARQSRGDDARHLRQYPHQEPELVPTAPKAASPSTFRAANRDADL